MTKFTITPSDSVETTADQATAFQSGSIEADTLIVETGALLSTTGVGANGATLDNTGGWTVQVGGSISSAKAFGIYLAAGNEDVSTIQVDKNAVVGGFIGIFSESAVTIANQGFIGSGGNSAVMVYGDDRHELINEGSINGPHAFISEFGASVDVIKNSGNLFGAIALGDGNDRITNSGYIDGDRTKHYVDFGHGDDRVTNSGEVRLAVLDGAGNDSFTNSGKISASVNLGKGDDIFTNFAKVDGRKVSGVATQEIDLGDGDDRFLGGKLAEDYHDAGGSDIVDFAGGNDIYRATTNGDVDGADTINGGKGIDTYDANYAINSVFINLDTVKHAAPFGFGPPSLAAGTVVGADVAGTTSDRIKGFEYVFAGGADDVVFGSKNGNYIDGGDGADILLGLGGNDHLLGSYGEDFLYGGAGLDILTGGTDADHFMFTAIGDSAAGAVLRDRITDFQDGLDLIDLSEIDAVKGGGNDAFTFIGTDAAFTGVAGELRVAMAPSGQVIEADIDGDKISDFSIAVADAPKTIVFTAADFEL